LGIGRSKSVDECEHVPVQVETFQYAANVCVVACGDSTSACALVTGEAFVFGKLAAEGLINHQYTPRRLDSLYENNLFITQVACGASHFAFLADQPQTQALRVLKQYVSRAHQRPSSRLVPPSTDDSFS
jgi:alpha-tubulin suppressor-like RCC1 family protein